MFWSTCWPWSSVLRTWDWSRLLGDIRGHSLPGLHQGHHLGRGGVLVNGSWWQHLKLICAHLWVLGVWKQLKDAKVGVEQQGGNHGRQGACLHLHPEPGHRRIHAGQGWLVLHLELGHRGIRGWQGVLVLHLGEYTAGTEQEPWHGSAQQEVGVAELELEEIQMEPCLSWLEWS